MRSLLILTLTMCLLAPLAGADDDVGMAAYERGEFEAAFDELLPLAEAGDAVAQYRIGALYSHGNGVEEDDAKTLYWYRKAAAQGHAVATYNLGVYYSKGYGVPANRQTALRYYREAAELGDITSASIIGSAFWLGSDVPEDKIEAVRWLHIAADGGHALAQNNLGIAYSEGMGVAQDHAKAVYWFQHHLGCRLALGVRGTRQGPEVDPDADLAKDRNGKLFQIRAEGGLQPFEPLHPGAQGRDRDLYRQVK